MLPVFLSRCGSPARRGAAALLLLLAACGRGTDTPVAPLSASAGQVTAASAAAVSRYAAARFAEQVSFGATPALVADIQRQGFSAWIDGQFALPASQIDTAPIARYDSQIPAMGNKAYLYANGQLYAAMLTAPDQLRQRVSWSLSQFVVTAMNKIEPYGSLSYANLLQREAFSTYGQLLRAVSVSPSMGVYLDNLQNRPTSQECPWCAPNENYARELMQLFTLGVVKLHPDGTVQRDARGRPQETYTQKDVEELARALTGWSINGNFDRTDYHRYDGEMVPDPWSAAHDRGAKVVLGRTLPANGEARQELDAVIQLLVTHQNTAPFVSLRLIQHLVTSDPSPAYVARVAAVFRDNGKGVTGDMKAVVKAILLDAEARRGDVQGADTNGFGKVREPLLWYTALLRGLGCTYPLFWDDTKSGLMGGSQRPYDPPSVFSFYLPTDRAPGSNLLAPEQRLLTSEELSFRLGNHFAAGVVRNGAQCDARAFGQAWQASPRAYADLVSERYFRGAMPAVLRQNLIDLMPDTWGDTPDQKAVSLLVYALSTPYFGAMR